MVRGRKPRPGSATENLHIRVRKEDLSRIRQRVDDIKFLIGRMRSLGIEELPGRTMGTVISQALSVYCSKLKEDCNLAELENEKYMDVCLLLSGDPSLSVRGIMERTGYSRDLVVRLVGRYHKDNADSSGSFSAE